MLVFSEGPVMAFSRRTSAAAAPREVPSAAHRLATLIAAHAPHDGGFKLPVSGAQAIRFSKVTKQRATAVVEPALCIVAQGAKTTMLGREVFDYDETRMLVFSVDLPISGHVTRATRQEPFLCFRLDLDPTRIAELAPKVFPNGIPAATPLRGMYVVEAQEGIVEAAARLLEFVSDQSDAALLAPLMVDEILIRLLRSSAGSRVAQIGRTNSAVSRIGRAVSEIRAHFAQPLAIESLARLVNMSASSFHQHFRTVTSMSPLQYQKMMRLQEARRLMLTESHDARSAALEVGYLSPSQFSREYVRLFGQSPARDVAELREGGLRAVVGQ
jgi:AraC-like DNA-binding protein